MVVVFVILVVSLVPSALSLWASHRAEQQMAERLDLARATDHDPIPWQPRHPDERYIDGIGLVIGDITCQLNARSPHIRCAVNPLGPCSSCRHFESRP